MWIVTTHFRKIGVRGVNGNISHCHCEVWGSSPPDPAKLLFVIMYKCKYCNRECKNFNSLKQHEIRCKENPNRIKCGGNYGNMPKHIKSWYNKYVVLRNGDTLDITNEQLEQYRKEHLTCEICGKTLKESVKWDSKFAPKNLCIDHEHTTKKFRGLLCSVCNRQLGWFEKNKEAILKYLNKDKVIND